MAKIGNQHCSKERVARMALTTPMIEIMDTDSMCVRESRLHELKQHKPLKRMVVHTINGKLAVQVCAVDVRVFTHRFPERLRDAPAAAQYTERILDHECRCMADVATGTLYGPGGVCMSSSQVRLAAR